MRHFSAYTAEELAADALFIRWVQHPDDSEVSLFWENWLARHPDREDAVELARQLVGVASQPPAGSLDSDEVRSVWGRIRWSIQEMPELKPLEPDVQSLATRWYLFRWAAALSGVLLFVIWMFWMQSMETVIAPKGAARTVRLPDGSTVVLNGNSELRYARVWADDMPRAVWLEGDASFTVAHRPDAGADRRFRVHTPNLTVEAEGTEFKVSHWLEATRVTLASGKVRLMLNDRPDIIEMKPGECVEIAPGQASMARLKSW